MNDKIIDRVKAHFDAKEYNGTQKLDKKIEKSRYNIS